MWRYFTRSVPIPVPKAKSAVTSMSGSSGSSGRSRASTVISLSTLFTTTAPSPRAAVAAITPNNTFEWIKRIKQSYSGQALEMEEEEEEHLNEFYRNGKTRKGEKEKILESIKEIFSDLVAKVSSSFEIKADVREKLMKLIRLINRLMDAGQSRITVIDNLIKTTLIKKLIESLVKKQYFFSASICSFLQDLDHRYSESFISEIVIAAIISAMENGRHEEAGDMAQFLKKREPLLFSHLPEELNSYSAAEVEVLAGKEADLSIVTHFEIFESFMGLLLSHGMKMIGELKVKEVKNICFLIVKNKADPTPIYNEIEFQIGKSLDDKDYVKAMVFADMLTSREEFYDYPHLVERLIRIESVLDSGSFPGPSMLRQLEKPTLIRAGFIRKQSEMVREYLKKGDISNALGRVRLLMQVQGEIGFSDASIFITLMKEVLDILEEDKSVFSVDFINFSVSLGRVLSFSAPLFYEYKNRIYSKLMMCYVHTVDDKRIKEISSILFSLKALPDIKIIEKDIALKWGPISLSRPSSRSYTIS